MEQIGYNQLTKRLRLLEAEVRQVQDVLRNRDQRDADTRKEAKEAFMAQFAALVPVPVTTIAANNPTEETEAMDEMQERQPIACDYDELDPAIAGLVRAVNRLSGLETMSSCQGFIGGHHPEKPWNVMFRATLPITEAGYASISLLYLIVTDSMLWESEWTETTAMKDMDVALTIHTCLDCFARHRMTHTIEGRRGDPDVLAAMINRWADTQRLARYQESDI